jgi:hypothetical protein
MGWDEFLRYANGPGVSVLVGALISELANYVPDFASLSPRGKRAVFFLACLAIPLSASLLGVATAGWPADWSATFWPALVAGFVAFASGTAVHLRKLGDKRAEVQALLAQLQEARSQVREMQKGRGNGVRRTGPRGGGGRSWKE